MGTPVGVRDVFLLHPAAGLVGFVRVSNSSANGRILVYNMLEIKCAPNLLYLSYGVLCYINATLLSRG